MVHIKICGKKR